MAAKFMNADTSPFIDGAELDIEKVLMSRYTCQTKRPAGRSVPLAGH